MSDGFHQLNHGGYVPEAQFQATGVFRPDQTALEAVHCPGDSSTARKGVHTIHIAQLVGISYGSQVVDPAAAAERKQGLILGSAVDWINRVRSIWDGVNRLAAYSTGETGVAAFENGLVDGRPVDGLTALEGPAHPVAGCQAAVVGCPGDPTGRARLAEHVDFLVLEVFHSPAS